MLNTLLNNWKVSSVMTVGSGRPLNATMAGDPNGDDNIYNDRLPGYSGTHSSVPTTSAPTCV